MSPEPIFDYIYGVLHSPAYRAKFKEFLKVDFPRIPYPNDTAEFSRFRDAGRELRMVHLMKDAEPTLSETRARFPVAGDNVVDAVRWEDGRVYIKSLAASSLGFPEALAFEMRLQLLTLRLLHAENAIIQHK